MTKHLSTPLTSDEAEVLYQSTCTFTTVCWSRVPSSSAFEHRKAIYPGEVRLRGVGAVDLVVCLCPRSRTYSFGIDAPTLVLATNGGERIEGRGSPPALRVSRAETETGFRFMVAESRP